jgi:uncharacterized protein YkwD
MLSVLLLPIQSGATPGLGPYLPPGTEKPSNRMKPLTPEQAAKALEMLTSPTKSTREKAVEALRMRWEDDQLKPQVIEILKKGIASRQEQLATALKKGVPGLAKASEAYVEWKAGRDALFPLIHTAVKDDPAKRAKLDQEMTRVELLKAALDRQLDSGRAAWKMLSETARPLTDLQRLLARVEESAQEPLEKTLEKLGSAKEFSQAFATVQRCEQVNWDFQEVNELNAKGSGIPQPAILFATLLNKKRHVLHLTPLRLDEALSKAASNHSSEMIRLGYFAHESPVPENKTPWIRAKNAGFQGNASGENIFMGSGAPDAAFGGWWGSDGHRFIMFADGPNTLGCGPVGSHWTMLTGNRKW